MRITVFDAARAAMSGGPPPQLERSLRRLGMVVLPLSVALIVHLTLEPYTFRMPAGGQTSLAGLWLRFWNGVSDPEDILNNLALFMSLGFSLACLLQGTRVRALARPLLALGVGLALSLSVELAQLFLPGRTSTRIDVLSNATGALLGYLIWLAARVWLASPARVMAGLAVYLAVAVGALAALPPAESLRNWDRRLPLMIGNEATADRPWRGEVERVQILSGAGDRGATWAASDAGREALLADYVRGANGRYRDLTGRMPDLLPQPAGEAAPGARASAQPVWYSTRAAVPQLSEPLASASAFTIIARVTAAESDQRGPARIISLSGSPFIRNFTVGQEGPDLIFRLRTLATGLNGTWPELRVPDVFGEARPRDIVITYRDGTVRCSVDGVARPETLRITPAWGLLAYLVPPEVLRNISGWLPFLSVSTLTLPDLICLALIFVPAGMLAALAGMQLPGRPQLGGYRRPLAVALVALGISLGLQGLLLVGGAFHLQAVEGLVGVGLAGGACVWFSRRAGVWARQR